MRGFLVLVMGGLGLGAFLRRLRRRPPELVGPDPADELRAKLAETKDAASGGHRPGELEEPDAQSPPDAQSRRRGVHERARQAIEELEGR